ncbi:MAG: SdrD B-like domain-containing protein, partial [Tepidisphaeraceae bacterium]
TVKANLTTSGLLIGLRKSGSPSGGGTGHTGSIQGRVFGDTNADGHLDAGEIGAAGKVVFLDTNNNGHLDAGETSTTTDSTGNFSFTGLSAGTYHVRRVFPSGYTYSTTLINEVLTDGEHATGLLIGSKTT